MHVSLEGEDYEELFFSLNFAGNVATEELCLNVSITEDSIVENTESFNLVLTSSDSRISIPFDQVPVLISDNDGRLLLIQKMLTYSFTFIPVQRSLYSSQRKCMK